MRIIKMYVKYKSCLFFFLFLFFILFYIFNQNSFIALQKNNINDNTNFFFKTMIIPNKSSKSEIIIETDVLKVFINLNGGNIEKVDLLNYKKKLHSNKPFTLLKKTKESTYITKSTIHNKDNFLDFSNPLFISEKKKIKLQENNTILSVPIICYLNKETILIKNFIFKKGEYVIEVKYNIKNLTNEILQLNLYNELIQNITYDKNITYLKKFFLKQSHDIAYSDQNNKYKKINFDKIFITGDINLDTNLGWISMLQKYFLSAWIPDSDGIKNIYIKKINDDTLSIGYISKDILIAPFSSNNINSLLWIGPTIQDKISILAKNLDLTIEYGWFSILSKPLFTFLNILYNYTNNWGYAIISITIIIRLLLYPFTKSQYISMLKMKTLQPEIDLIKEKFSKNKQKMSEKLLLFYKKKKINPLSGCLPVLIQMPIFLSLYYMLNSVVELRHAPFIFWIEDLSDKDPLYILPILMGLSMWLVQKCSYNNISDPLQKKIINVIPIFFTFFFLWFPSGLVLYYIVSNFITIIQQYLINFFLMKQKNKFYIN